MQVNWSATGDRGSRRVAQITIDLVWSPQVAAIVFAMLLLTYNTSIDIICIYQVFDNDGCGPKMGNDEAMILNRNVINLYQISLTELSIIY